MCSRLRVLPKKTEGWISVQELAGSIPEVVSCLGDVLIAVLCNVKS